MLRGVLLALAVASGLLSTAAAAGVPTVRVAAIEHGDVFVQTPGAPPEQLTHDGKLATFAWSSRGDLAALAETRLLVRTAAGETRTYPLHGYVPPVAWS